MNEEIFNLQLRKFLKNVGITSQREIEKAVLNAIDSGQIHGNETITANVSLTIPDLNLETKINGNIKLG